MNNYILESGNWILQKGEYVLPSLNDYWCINLYDDNLKHIGHGYYSKKQTAETK